MEGIWKIINHERTQRKINSHKKHEKAQKKKRFDRMISDKMILFLMIDVSLSIQ